MKNRETMIEKLFETFLRLGHSTSEKLGFAHQNDSNISFGEETITETNLLELQRFPDLVTIKAFSKKKEGRNGADWEWRILGDKFNLHMRVQAKRVDKHGYIRNMEHRRKTSTKSQRELLIKDARKYNLRPVYCLYSAKNQREIWNFSKIDRKFNVETGCLLCNAIDVQRLRQTGCEITSFRTLEQYSVPWHYLFIRSSNYTMEEEVGSSGGRVAEGTFRTLSSYTHLKELQEDFPKIEVDLPHDSSLPFPTVVQLNERHDDFGTEEEGVDLTQDPPLNGIHPATRNDGIADMINGEQAPRDHYLERGIRGVIIVDGRNYRD